MSDWGDRDSKALRTERSGDKEAEFAIPPSARVLDHVQAPPHGRPDSSDLTGGTCSGYCCGGSSALCLETHALCFGAWCERALFCCVVALIFVWGDRK